ncbi:hypothetical protein CPB86DRAFT_813861 [Serendipita vermifera]|nr:hypothetical protein CPB86DRAFT_813861 [Serendipita vermifera]
MKIADVNVEDQQVFATRKGEDAQHTAKACASTSKQVAKQPNVLKWSSEKCRQE